MEQPVKCKHLTAYDLDCDGDCGDYTCLNRQQEEEMGIVKNLTAMVKRTADSLKIIAGIAREKRISKPAMEMAKLLTEYLEEK